LTGANGARPRAVIVVTGSELVRGERTDLNGPFLARSLLALGIEPTRIHLVGDDPAELEAAVAEAVASADLVATSGGLGPTHDDRTVRIVAKVAGLAVRVDVELEAQIEGVSRMVAERMKRPYADFSDGVTKQATVPEPSTILGLAGTAPGLVVEANGTPIIVLPGPPVELQRLWPRALEAPEVRRLLDRGTPPLWKTLRFFGPGESQVAQAFHEAGGDGDGLEVTICARSFEIHVDLVAEPSAEQRLLELETALSDRLGRFLYSSDGRGVEEIVLDRCRSLGWTLATAESCTGGLVAAALTAIPGSSDVITGGIVAYANGVKTGELGVAAELIDRHGAVSAEVAEAMAHGVRERLGVDVAVSITGVAGPGGGTEETPVGLVYFHAETPEAGKGGFFSFPGDRDSIRRRSVVASLHLLRRLLEQNRDKAA
jgi:nicotinamide-nucleotide amidase